MNCAVCGAWCRGRQWWNRDTGYGLCVRCADWLKGRGEPAEETERLYGRRGEHYACDESEADHFRDVTKKVPL